MNIWKKTANRKTEKNPSPKKKTLALKDEFHNLFFPHKLLTFRSSVTHKCQKIGKRKNNNDRLEHLFNMD